MTQTLGDFFETLPKVDSRDAAFNLYFESGGDVSRYVHAEIHGTFQPTHDEIRMVYLIGRGEVARDGGTHVPCIFYFNSKTTQSHVTHRLDSTVTEIPLNNIRSIQVLSPSGDVIR